MQQRKAEGGGAGEGSAGVVQNSHFLKLYHFDRDITIVFSVISEDGRWAQAGAGISQRWRSECCARGHSVSTEAMHRDSPCREGHGGSLLSAGSRGTAQG